jgi:fucose permease
MRNSDSVTLSRGTQHFLVSEVPALILLAYLSLVTLGLIDNIRGPFFPEVLADLGLNGTRGSAFFAVVSFFAFIGSMTSHIWVKRWSTLSVLLTASLVFGLGFALVSRSHSFPALIASCMVFGLAFGTLNVTQNVLVCEGSTPRSRRQWLSGLHGAYGISALTAPLIATFLRGHGFSWRDSFLLLAAAPVLMTLFGIWAKPPRPLHEGKPLALARSDRRYCVLFCALMAMYLWGELSASTRLVLWLRAERGFSPSDADMLLAGFFLALLSGRLFFMFVHFPRLNNWLVLCLSAFLGAGLYVLSLHASPWIVVAAALAMAPFYPVVMDQASAVFGNKAPQAMSYIIGVGNLSLVVMHVTIGWLGDVMGVTAALHCGGAALAVVGLLILPQLKERR